MLSSSRVNLYHLIAMACSLWFLVPTANAKADEANVVQSRATSPSFIEPFQQIDHEVEAAIQQQQIPGAVVAIGYSGQLVFLRAYGNRQLQPSIEAMTVDTLFDLASLTKPIVTACCVMKLVEQHVIELDDPVSKHLPDFAVEGKQAITIKQLLLHTSGLTPDNSMSDYRGSRDEALGRALALPLDYPTGSKFRYSDVGFIVLGKLVEQKTGDTLAEFASKQLYVPLGMDHTCFLPDPLLSQRAAVTQQREGRWMKGEVHDPRAYALGGVAGHAGLFSTAGDLAKFAQMLLDQGQGNSKSILKPETVKTMTASYEVPGGIRGLGWDKQSAYSSNRGRSMSAEAFGHGGFTGTGLWIDPPLKLYVIFLSNRVHLGEKTAVNSLIGRIGTLAADAAIAAETNSSAVDTR